MIDILDIEYSFFYQKKADLALVLLLIHETSGRMRLEESVFK
jgi:hypothetical protein